MMSSSRETDLELPETSGKLTIGVNPDDHMIAKLTPEFDIERDRAHLVAVPRPGTLSTAEKLVRDIEALRQDIIQSQRINDEKIDHLNKELAETKNSLSDERSKNSYCFGALTVIRIWAKLLYDRVTEDMKKEEAQKQPRKKAKVDIKPFNQFFKELIFPPFKETSTEQTMRYRPRKNSPEQTMKDRLRLSDDDITFIRTLIWSRNFHAHGEKEFFNSLESKNAAIVKEGFEYLKENLQDAQYYKDKNPRIVEIAFAFLRNIHQDLLDKKLLID